MVDLNVWRIALRHLVTQVEEKCQYSKYGKAINTLFEVLVPIEKKLDCEAQKHRRKSNAEP